MAGLVLARVVDPVTAQQVVGVITGMGVWDDPPSFIPRRRDLEYEGMGPDRKHAQIGLRLLYPYPEKPVKPSDLGV